MSSSLSGINNLSGIHSSNVPDEHLPNAFFNQLEQGLHGISFSPYLNGQEPGDPITESQIAERLDIIRPYTRWIRTFSCTEGNELIPRIAKDKGIRTMVGAWIGDDEEKNQKELEQLLEIAKSGLADIVAVGNEVLYREEMPLDELIETIRAVKAELPDNQIGYVDAYYEFCNHPELVDVCDVILANCYPYWEGCHADYALLYIKDMYRRVIDAARGKPIAISETGWPNGGEAFGDSIPSDANALRFFLNVQQWAKADNIDMFYFSSFDEDWKTGDEGDVGAFWGLWDSAGKLKYLS